MILGYVKNQNVPVTDITF